MIYEILGGAAEHLTNHLGHGLGYVLPPLYVGLSHMRKIGFERVNDLVTEAMLRPEIARTLLAKVPDAEAPAMAKKLAAQMAALTLNAGLQASVLTEGQRGPRFWTFEQNLRADAYRAPDGPTAPNTAEAH